MKHGKTVLMTTAVATAAVLALYQSSAGGDEPAPAAMPADSSPVLVELFTSQGCSSCPPADRLLRRLGEDGQAAGVAVVPLSFHVDYWNYIGWTDPFSSAEWSERQRVYAESFEAGRVYTPQLVINGRRDCVGSNEPTVRREIERAAREGAAGRLAVEVAAGPDAGKLSLEIEARVTSAVAEATSTWSVMVAVFENDLETPVSRGENGGRELRNSHVVRSLSQAFALPARAGAERSGQLEITLDEAWNRDRLGVAVFLQDLETRHVHGAAVRYL